MLDAVDAERLTVLQLQNARGSRAQFTNAGCALMALEFAGTDVVLGYDTPAQYVDDELYMGVVVGPVAGRIAGGALELPGEAVSLPVADTGHHLHGEAAGFGRCIWDILEATDHRLGFRYHRVDGEGGYPGALQVTVEYELTDDDILVVRYHAQADRVSVISPSQHSYFNLAGHGSGDIADHTLHIDAERYIPLDDDLIPLCGPVPVEGTPMDLREGPVLAGQLGRPDAQLDIAKGYDHSWVLNPERDWQQRPAARLHEPQFGRTLSLYTDRPALHCYSGNMIAAGIRGKGGAHYAARGGLCLETQHLPRTRFDAAAARVAPGEDFRSETRFAFSGF